VIFVPLRSFCHYPAVDTCIHFGSDCSVVQLSMLLSILVQTGMMSASWSSVRAIKLPSICYEYIFYHMCMYRYSLNPPHHTSSEISSQICHASPHLKVTILLLISNQPRLSSPQFTTPLLTSSPSRLTSPKAYHASKSPHLTLSKTCHPSHLHKTTTSLLTSNLPRLTSPQIPHNSQHLKPATALFISNLPNHTSPQTSDASPHFKPALLHLTSNHHASLHLKSAKPLLTSNLLTSPEIHQVSITSNPPRLTSQQIHHTSPYLKPTTPLLTSTSPKPLNKTQYHQIAFFKCFSRNKTKHIILCLVRMIKRIFIVVDGSYLKENPVISLCQRKCCEVGI
jgi:hypothetical protein